MAATPHRSASPPAYREVQRFRQWWIWLILVPVVGAAWWAFVQQILGGQPFGSNPGPDWVVWLVFVLFGLGLPVLLLAARLVIEVNATELDLRYVPFRRRRIPLGDVQDHEAVTFRPIREWGGWGIRWARGRGWAYTVRGDRGVQLHLSGGAKLLVGSARA